MCITCSLLFDTILYFSNYSCRNFFCIFFILNNIIPNNSLRHDVVTDLLLQPLFSVIKLHSFLLCTVLRIQFSTPHGIQGFRCITCYYRYSLIFLFFIRFRIVTLKYNSMFFIVVIIQFISALLFLWLDVIWYLFFFIIYYLILTMFSWYCEGSSSYIFSWRWSGST